MAKATYLLLLLINPSRFFAQDSKVDFFVSLFQISQHSVEYGLILSNTKIPIGKWTQNTYDCP